jgi:acetyl-CoA carboxylase biotin carboxyl carrier protein
MDLKEIKSIIDLMTKAGLSEFELEKGDFKLRVKRGPNGEWTTAAPASAPQVVHHHGPVGAYAAPVAHSPAAASIAAPGLAPTAALAPEASGLSQIVSPMVGQEVQEDTVVCIIEAMKVMNEIKAETKGIIVEVLAQNGKSVDFGKPLFAVRPL